MSQSKKSVERGQSITFRVPSDTPDHILKQLSTLKETERRNFSSKIAEFVLAGVSQSMTKEKETVTIPLPKPLTKEQRNWIKHEHSEALIGTILYQLMMDPIRATTLLASLNSNAYHIDDALYLQEEAAAEEPIPSPAPIEKVVQEQEVEALDEESAEDDLDSLDLDSLQDELHLAQEEEESVEDDDPLGDFLTRMNQ